VTAGRGPGAAHRTVEVRWIIDGACPEAVVRRFVTSASEEPEERTDLYLATGSAALGVKSRAGGGIDVKVRRSTGAVLEAGATTGLVEEWDGWAFDASGEPEVDGSTWRPVAKRRWRRAWSIAPHTAPDPGRRPEDLAPRRAGPAEHLDAGATVELAEVLLDGGTAAWTVAVEAWGVDRDDAVDGIRLVLEQEQARFPVDALVVGSSRSYPEWLAGAASPAEPPGGSPEERRQLQAIRATLPLPNTS
jgi:hypothetical protein